MENTEVRFAYKEDQSADVWRVDHGRQRGHQVSERVLWQRNGWIQELLGREDKKGFHQD